MINQNNTIQILHTKYMPIIYGISIITVHNVQIQNGVAENYTCLIHKYILGFFPESVVNKLSFIATFIEHACS